MPTVRVAMPPIDAASQGLLRASQGLLQEGRPQRRDPARSTKALRSPPAVAGGTADIGQVQSELAVPAHERGLPFVAIAGSNMYVSTTHQSELVVARIRRSRRRRTSTVRCIAVGRTQERPRSCVQQVDGHERRQLDLDEDRRDPVRGNGRSGRVGRVDAAMMAEPQLSGALASQARQDPRRRRSSRSVKSGSLGTWFTTSTYAKAHPDVIKAFAAAMAMSADWANHNQAESGKLLAAKPASRSAQTPRASSSRPTSTSEGNATSDRRLGEIRFAEKYVPRLPAAHRAVA